MIIVEFNGKFTEMSNNDLVLLIAKQYQNAKFHRLHFRKDIGKFEDEVLTSEQILEEYEDIGTDFTFTGVDGIDCFEKMVEEIGANTWKNSDYYKYWRC